MAKEQKNILAGDIGGTKTLLGLFTADGPGITPVEKQRFHSPDYASLTEIISAFQKKTKLDMNRESACFGIAGPCEGGVCRTRNLPWVIDSEAIRSRFGFRKVTLLNDFEAVVYGVPKLGREALEIFNEGVKDPRGNMAVLGAGTGLGEAFAVYDTAMNRYRVFPSEGGHADFAPNNDQEIDLLKYLRKVYEHVSYERILSGHGFVNIYSYLDSTGRYEVPEEIRDEIRKSPDPAAVISRLGMEGGPEICRRALDLFVAIYGAEAGNLALKILPAGGLFIAGGIAAKIREKFKEGAFLHAFLNKGRSGELLKNIPVSIVMNPDVGLIGAAVKAME